MVSGSRSLTGSGRTSLTGSGRAERSRRRVPTLSRTHPARLPRMRRTSRAATRSCARVVRLASAAMRIISVELATGWRSAPVSTGGASMITVSASRCISPTAMRQEKRSSSAAGSAGTAPGGSSRSPGTSVA